MTQGYPLSKVAYGIGILPVIKLPKSANPDVTQYWYADNAGALGMFDNLGEYFNLLKHNCPDWGYYSNTTKTILIVHLDNPKWGNCLARIMGLWFTQGHIKTYVP